MTFKDWLRKRAEDDGNPWGVLKHEDLLHEAYEQGQKGEPMKMMVTLEEAEVIKILNEAVSKSVGQPMAVRNTYAINNDVEFESAEVLAEREAARVSRAVTPVEEAVEDKPRLTTELSKAAQEVEEEVSL